MFHLIFGLKIYIWKIKFGLKLNDINDTIIKGYDDTKGKKRNMAKKTVEKTLNIDNILFNCRDYLRAARNSGSFFEKEI